MEIEYDIFISFKNSDEEGNPTKDKELAHKLYLFLQSKNLKIFFSNATLEELGTDSWSKEIQRALKVSKIFIALGSREEYFDSYWLQRERRAFLTRKEDDKSKALYSYIAPPMTTNDLHDEIKEFECFEDTKPNEFDRLYSFISNHLARYFQRIKDDEFLDKDLANPYKGLFHFTYEDRDNYFGREKESQEIAQIVKESRFFTLLGASGSGKSSLLFAGISPLIKEKSVAILDFRPQDRPFRNLANIFIKALYPDRLMQIEKKEELTNKLLDGTIKLDDLTEEYFENQKIEKLYIIIDQFEELFILTKDSKIKNLFLDQLLQLVESNLNVTLIISLRADFLSFASYYEPFNQTINQNPKMILGLMNEENLKRAIELPAKNLGVRFEKGLIERILEEISKEAGQLPLLEFALEQFWQKMSSRVITHKSLDEMGSISHAISYHADKVYKKYPNKEAVRRIFLKLVNSGSGTEDTRRVAKFEDFDKSDRDTITLLATDRLVITTENSVEVVHEALIREWSILKAWIEEDREFLEWEKRTRIDLEFYKDNGEREEDLLRDGKLLRAKEFLESYKREVSGEFWGFIERSVGVQKRRERKKRAVLGGVFVSLLIVIGVIGYFWKASEESRIIAEEAKIIADGQKYQTNKLLYKMQGIIGIELMQENNKTKFYVSIINMFKFYKNEELNQLKSMAYASLGFIYYDECLHDDICDIDKVLSTFEKSVKLNPNQEYIYDIMGYIYQVFNNDKDKAIEMYEKSVNINFKKFEHYFDLATLYYSKNRYKQVINICEKSIKINSQNDKIYFILGRAYQKNKQYNKALVAYKKSIILNPLNSNAYYFPKERYQKEKGRNYNVNYIHGCSSLYYERFFQLQLIQNQLFNQNLEIKYKKIFLNQKENFIVYEMLKIFQDITHNKIVNLEQWEQKYLNVKLYNYNFNELREWIDGFEDGEIKTRLVEALGVFENHR